MTRFSRIRQGLRRAVQATLIAIFSLLVIIVPLELSYQWEFAAAIIVGCALLNRSRSRRVSIALSVVSVLVSTRYIFWRATSTLSFGGPLEAVLGLTLYAAELYAWVILLLGAMQTAFPLRRPLAQVEGPPETWPRVDVYIPTYNESLAIVRNTVMAALDMDYPADRFRVYILDDGRRPEFRAFARQVGCGYLTRDNNLHAKAGNMNAAMKKTDGEYIAIFDCDHVPTRAFLQLSVGWFQRDDKLAMVQTPHYFYSPDPIQRNIAQVEGMPGEGELFYGPTQMGNDLWNATFFCGSCAVIRREALDQTNGFIGDTVTEDAHTALQLQRKGWNTAYLNARLAAGLATERLVLHIGQRIRWARGMTQILRIDNPLTGPGLKWPQRLCYLNAMMHFQFPLPRIVFLVSPLFYLILGQNIINASASLIFAYAVPHLFCASLEGTRSQGGHRRPFWGEIYETILAFHLVKPTVMTWFQPRKGKFNVTDKGDLLSKTFFDWGIVTPHLICAGLLLGGIALGWAKLIYFPYLFNIQADTLELNTAWALFSVFILMAAISVARETRQVREDVRIPADLKVSVYMRSGHVLDGVTNNVSMGGAAVILPAKLPGGVADVTHLAMPIGDEILCTPVETVRVDGNKVYVKFEQTGLHGANQLVRAVLGRADAWQTAESEPPVSTLRSLRDIMAIDLLTLKRLLRLNFTERRKLAQMAAEEAAAAQTSAKARAAAEAKPTVEPEAPARPTSSLRKLLAATAAVVAVVLAGASLAGIGPMGERALAQPAATAQPVAAASGSRHLHLTLRELQVKSAVHLAGTRGEIGIPFSLRNTDVVSDAALTLRLSWSPALIPDISQLLVMINGEVVQTVPLVHETASGLNLRIPVNPAVFLPGDNTLNLRLVGHYTRDCEDPFHSSLWANISNTQSALDLTLMTDVKAAPDLAQLPRPFFDRADVGPLNLPFVFAANPKAPELQAASAMASYLGSLASYRGFHFKPVIGQLPTGNAIVFAKASNAIPGLQVPISGPGVVMVRNPVDAAGTLLVIVGRNDDELRLAAGAVANRHGGMNGASYAFDGTRLPLWPRYSAPRWINTSRPVRLGEIMASYDLQGLGLPPGPLNARFRVAPDLFFWPRQGGVLDLTYRYPSASWLDRRNSRLDISINNQFLKTLPLSGGAWWSALFGMTGASSNEGHEKVTLPRYALFGQNNLIFDFNLMLANRTSCPTALPENVRVALDPNSTIDFSNAYHAMALPDLATFAGAGYPFTIRPDLSETAILVDPTPSPAAIEALLDLMGRMGDATGVATTGVTILDHFDADQLKGRDIMVIGSAGLAARDTLFGNAPLQYVDGALRVREVTPLEHLQAFFGGGNWFTGADDAQNQLTSTRGLSSIASFESPLTPGKTVVALVAEDQNTLPPLVDSLDDPKVNAQVQGDLSVVAGDGMTSFMTGHVYWIGDLPVWVRAMYWVSSHPFLLAGMAIALALLLAWPIHKYLKARARRRLSALGDDA